MVHVPAEDLAAKLLSARDGNTQIAPLTAGNPGFSMAEAQVVADHVRKLRTARGERVVGRKIGFTNRTLWPLYGVDGPIWGDVFDTTLTYLPGTSATVPLPNVPEPRIEPEIVFGLSSTPGPEMEHSALLECIEWVAHGFEVVTSIYPGWTFAATDTQAAFGLHGALYVGPKHPVRALGSDPVAALSDLRLTLSDGTTATEGHGRDVLDGPVQALGYFVRQLADTGGAPMVPGDVVTTGTLTDAMPIVRGARWRTALSASPLDGLDVTFV